MKLCAVSFKVCWRDESGNWYSDGGFPLQMSAIGSIFDSMELLVVEGAAQAGGLRLPEAHVVPLRSPDGVDFRRKLSILFNLPYYVSFIAKHTRRADAVHVPLPGDIPLIALVVALALRKPIVARYCGSWQKTSVTTLMNRVTRGVMRTFAGKRNVMLATGDGSESPAPGMDWIFASALSREEVSSIQPVLDRELGTPPRLVYIGRLAPEKGLSGLIRAIHALSHERVGLAPTITLIGDGPERVALQELSRKIGCDAQVRFTGQLNRAELSKRLLEADMCVQPSLTEGFSKAWLDAMAHGLPVLASDVGAASAVVGRDGERGWLTPPGDVEALRKKLVTILTNTPDWCALRHRCRRFAESRTLDDWRDRIAELCASKWNCAYREGKLS